MFNESQTYQYFAEESSPEHLHQAASERPVSANAGGPMRVLPLAIVAVIATALIAEVACAAIWNLSGHRYAAQIISDAL